MRRQVIALIAALVPALCHADPEVEPVVIYNHQSDLFRGKPFNNQWEPQHDYVGAGVSITLGERKRFNIELSHGRQSISRASWESGSAVSARYFPFRGRN